jgi:hypothetical protein
MVHKINFQIKSNSLHTWTPPNPLGPRNLTHSAAMSLNFHSNNSTMAPLPGTVLGVLWAWMFATDNKRHIRCSSTILQDVLRTHWKCFTIYTARIQGHVHTLNRSYHLCFSSTSQHIILTNLFTTPSNSCHIYLAYFDFPKYAHSSAENHAVLIIFLKRRYYVTFISCHS